MQAGVDASSRHRYDVARTASVAQLDRVLPSEGRGRGFESRRVHQLQRESPRSDGLGLFCLPGVCFSCVPPVTPVPPNDRPSSALCTGLPPRPLPQHCQESLQLPTLRLILFQHHPERAPLFFDRQLQGHQHAAVQLVADQDVGEHRGGVGDLHPLQPGEHRGALAGITGGREVEVNHGDHPTWSLAVAGTDKSIRFI